MNQHDHTVTAAANPARFIDLYCVPCAGGSTELYRGWDRLLPEWIKVRPVELPGRGRRFGEALNSHAKALAAELIAGLDTRSPNPFILFGHSMGALLVHEMALQLQAAGKRLPALLILSGLEPPHQWDQTDDRSLLSDEALLQYVQRYGALPQALENSPEMLKIFLPILRNDFALGDHYRFQADAPLTCPLYVVAGDAEPDFGPAQLEEWSRYSERWLGVRCFKGGHFYLSEPAERKNLLDSICQVIGEQRLRHAAQA